MKKNINENTRGKYALELLNVDKIYNNGFQAVFNTNIKINEGEFIVFVGPSGCGKSTTLRMIAGLEKVSKGQIFMKGDMVTDLDTRFRNLSMVFQSYALFPHLSVRENLAFTLKVKKQRKEIIEQKVNWAAKKLGLEFYLSRKPKELSGGQRQRVALGRAIVADPHLFLLDEPLSNLDAKLRADMRDVIKNLHNELGSTSVYVTHDQVEAMTMADRIVVMKDGFVQQIDSPNNVFNNPSCLFVAEFIGTPTMNFLSGNIKGSSFIAKGFTAKLPKGKYDNKARKHGVIFGIRPQHIYTKEDVTNTSKYVKVIGDVMKSELLGDQSIVTIKTKQNVIFTFLSRKHLTKETGKNTSVFIDVNECHIFDKETTFSISSKINKDSMDALTSWRDSSEEIKIRKSVMEAEKRKGEKKSLTQKATSVVVQKINPPEFAKYKVILDKKIEISNLKMELVQFKTAEKSNQAKQIKLEIRSNERKFRKQILESDRKIAILKQDGMMAERKKEKEKQRNIKKIYRGDLADKKFALKKEVAKYKNDNGTLKTETVFKIKELKKELKIIKKDSRAKIYIERRKIKEREKEQDIQTAKNLKTARNILKERLKEKRVDSNEE